MPRGPSRTLIRQGLSWVVALASLSTASDASAWGTKGHHVVALIAEAELTPKARDLVGSLLGGDPRTSMLEASMWPDETRARWPETKPYHYVDMPLASAGFDRGRDCPKGDCIVAAVERFATVLGSNAPQAKRREALSYVLHLVGDIHQPLHCADHADRGGNDVKVILGGRATNLHAVWDVDVVEVLGTEPASVAAALQPSITDVERALWAAGSPAAWATETFGVAKEVVYAGLAQYAGKGLQALPPGYKASMAPVAAAQLRKAGVRLAWVLNRAAAGPLLDAAKAGLP